MVEPLLLERLKKEGPLGYERIARAFDLSISEVRDLDIEHNNRFHGYDVERMKQYEVARCRPEKGWNNTLRSIREAREKYDAGLIEMVTGRCGKELILYAIPRVHIDRKREPYFSRKFQE